MSEPKAETGKAKRKQRSTKQSTAKQNAAKQNTPKNTAKNGAKGPAKTARAKAKATPQRQPSPADLLGLTVLLLTASLAACTAKNKGPTPVDTTGLTGQVTIRFLDVGQGDAVLISSPEGRTMLVDGGRSAGRMAELLQEYGVRTLDLVVASHADFDHVAGLTEAAKLGPKLFINNGLSGNTQTWGKVVDAMQGAGATFQKANNQQINLGSVKVKILAPPDNMPDDQNNHSVGVRVDFGNFHALMTGDSEKRETEGWIAAEQPDTQGPVQVYKSIHHGAANGDHQAWLDRVKPENVVVSVGPNNYGHPTQSALDLYAKNNAKVFRTDESGTVTFKGNPDGTFTVKTEK